MTTSHTACLKHLADASRDGTLVIFCGAGISKPAPTNLPTGDDIVCGVLDKICAAMPYISYDLVAGSNLFRNAPFELFMGVIEQGLQFRVYEVMESLVDGDPNQLHRRIARLMASGAVPKVITTNFDNMIERALVPYGKPFTVTYSWEDSTATQPSGHGSGLFKIHGSFVDSFGKDITRTTVLTTLDGINRSSRSEVLLRWARFLRGKTLLFLGYGGRDRIDVMRLLGMAEGTSVFWVDHSNSHSTVICHDTPTISKELRVLIGTRPESFTLISGHTLHFLESLAAEIGESMGTEALAPLEPAPSLSRPLTFMPVFMAPLFPKYAGLAAGYLFLWSGWARQAALSFGTFFETNKDEERRLEAWAYRGMAQAFEMLGQGNEAEQAYTLAIRRFWGLGDYAGITITMNYFADMALSKDKIDQARDLVDQALRLAEREEDEARLALSLFNLGRIEETEGKLEQACRTLSQASAMAARAGEFWVEAGALQASVRVEHDRTGRYTERMLQDSLTVMENIHWIGGGSAPSTKVAGMEDSIELPQTVADAAVATKGRKAREFLRTNETVLRCRQTEEVILKLRER